MAGMSDAPRITDAALMIKIAVPGMTDTARIAVPGMADAASIAVPGMADAASIAGPRMIGVVAGRAGIVGTGGVARQIAGMARGSAGAAEPAAVAEQPATVVAGRGHGGDRDRRAPAQSPAGKQFPQLGQYRQQALAAELAGGVLAGPPDRAGE